MKTNRLPIIVTVAIGLVSWSATSCARESKSTDSSIPVVSTSTPAGPALPATTPAGSAAEVNADDLAVKWLDIKDCTFDTRERFFAGLKVLEATVDRQIALRNAKRAAMPSTVDTKEWDFVMKELTEARAYLKDKGDELRKATPETWGQLKDTVGEAWTRTQNANAKVKQSTTT